MEDLITKFRDVGITHFSQSQLNQPLDVWAFKYVALSAEDRKKMRVGYKAIYGTAVHNGIQDLLVNGISEFDTSLQNSIAGYDLETAKDGDEIRGEMYRQYIEPAMANGYEALKDNFSDAIAETKIELILPDVVLPIIGYVDLIKDNLLCEMKTKIGNPNPVKKDGTRTLGKVKIPDRPQREHIEQVAIYSAATGCIPSIMYVSHEEATVYTPFNCEDLLQYNLDAALERVRLKALKRQNLITFSNDINVIGSILEPDFNHPYFWDMEQKEYAMEIFR